MTQVGRCLPLFVFTPSVMAHETLLRFVSSWATAIASSRSIGLGKAHRVTIPSRCPSIGTSSCSMRSSSGLGSPM
ncbi:MAG: hypothetical protein U0165_11280 [Polyangiaceae bacterium]